MDQNTYDRFGFDKDGYNKNGYNRMGYDHEGYDREGFDMQGFNRDGINKLTGRDKGGYDIHGFDKEGFNHEGFDKNGFGKDGYNKNGYDKDGYNKYGLTADGYDRSGYNEEGFDRDGFDRDGYGHDGYNREGYNCDGYNRNGRDSDGYDHDGYDPDGYDKKGYGKDGYDREGYDHKGYNRVGYNKAGYDRNGFNEEGRDQYGYDREGYRKDGFNRYGYDRDGFNRKGFNKEGYNREGFNKDGYDKEGYNINGFDKSGFDREGYDFQGYNLIGYNREGFDRDGFDLFGFNKNGYNREGYDKDGYDEKGFNTEGTNRNGINLFGYGNDGYNILGYDKNGFNREGISPDGFPRDLFDEEGYHIYTGFNIKGYDRDGFSINGYDKEGYDREGFNVVTGYNREGFDRHGFSRRGYNKDGYDKNGFNVEGYDYQGYDKTGYNVKGYDRNGYDREGYDKKGYDQDGFNRKGERNPLIADDHRDNILESDDDILERQYFDKCCAQIRGFYKDEVQKRIYEDYKPVVREYIDRWGFVQTDIRQPDMELADRKVRSAVEKVLKEPYFAHVNYKGNTELYIGKTAVHGWVTDWADQRASYYYQYQIYIGDSNAGLEYVRDITIKDRKYIGYKDLYNKNDLKKDIIKVADEHLLRIIAANKSNKKIHDIVETIQQNQYNIITTDKNKDILVLGCAGSGKTMILLHRIRYIKYNDPDLDMGDFVILSPTDILARESKELSRLLNISETHQYTSSSFYRTIIGEYLNKEEIEYDDFNVVDNAIESSDYYSVGYLESICEKIEDILSNVSDQSNIFFASESDKIKDNEIIFLQKFGNDKGKFYELRKAYPSVIKEIRETGKADVLRLVGQIDKKLLSNEKKSLMKEKVLDYKEIISYLLDTGIFKKGKGGKNNKQSIEGYFFYTRKLIDRIDMESFIRIAKGQNYEARNLTDPFLILQCFCDSPLDKDNAIKLLDEWKWLTEDTLSEYIAYLDKEYTHLIHLERKREMLQALLDEDVFPNRQIRKELKSDDAFEKTMHFYEGSVPYFGKNLINSLDYFERYQKLVDKKKRLSAQRGKEGKYQYLFDIVKSILNVKEEIGTPCALSISEAFVCLFVFSRKFGPIEKKKKYFFIDEFQDFSNIELELIKKIYPSSTFGYYGDVMQCISNKGISDVSSLPATLYTECFEINENYRNAVPITEYINSEFGMNMMAVGLPGIQKNLEQLKEIPIEEDDRVALIIKDGKKIEYPYYFKVNEYIERNDIIRGYINIIPISKVKGLEFEKVIVIKAELTDNEFYVACTRALSELYIITNYVYQEGGGSEEIIRDPPLHSEKDDNQSENINVVPENSHDESPLGSGKEKDYDETIISKFPDNKKPRHNGGMLIKRFKVYTRKNRGNADVYCSICKRLIKDETYFSRNNSAICQNCADS